MEDYPNKSKERECVDMSIISTENPTSIENSTNIENPVNIGDPTVMAIILVLASIPVVFLVVEFMLRKYKKGYQGNTKIKVGNYVRYNFNILGKIFATYMIFLLITSWIYIRFVFFGLNNKSVFRMNIFATLMVMIFYFVLFKVEKNKKLILFFIMPITYLVGVVFFFFWGIIPAEDIYLFTVVIVINFGLILSETFLLWHLIWFYIQILRFRNPKPFQNENEIDLNDFQVVAIVPAHNEPIALVNQCVKSLAKVHFPQENMILCLADDSGYDRFKGIAKRINKMVHLHQKPRYNDQSMHNGDRIKHRISYMVFSEDIKRVETQEVSNYKAFNLNNCLNRIRNRLLDSKKIIISIFDSDYIIKPNFFKHMLCYIDPGNTVLLQTPQYYYNRRAMCAKVAFSTNELLYQCICTGIGRSNAQFLLGTNYLLSYDALRKTGGDYIENYTVEDVPTSLSLWFANNKVEKTYNEFLFVPHILTSGYGPEDIYNFLDQQLKWLWGSLQSIYLFWFPEKSDVEMPKKPDNISFSKRIHFFSTFTWYFMNTAFLLQFMLLLGSSIIAFLDHFWFQTKGIQYSYSPELYLFTLIFIFYPLIFLSFCSTGWKDTLSRIYSILITNFLAYDYAKECYRFIKNPKGERAGTSTKKEGFSGFDWADFKPQLVIMLLTLINIIFQIFLQNWILVSILGFLFLNYAVLPNLLNRLPDQPKSIESNLDLGKKTGNIRLSIKQNEKVN